ncbi:MAG: hypothetical protein GY795_00545 [Desulfobacterales bacterium]|nr:hypothetical protein [Desulfobacterales bacterium]
MPNGEKILSLYEDDVQVIKRGKLGANIEFGNRFYLAEQRDGLIVDWDFFTSENKSDAKILEESVKRVKKSYDLKAYTTDRGFNSEKNSHFLSKEGVFDGTCPRSVPALKIKMADERFRALQKRRAQTEARIGIFKNVFTGEKILRKGTVNRTLKVVWSVLTHNLWVLARLAVANKQQRELQAAA